MKNGHNISFSDLPGKFLPVSDINDLPESQFVQPAGVLVVDCSTGCLRMISEIPPLVRFLSSHHEFSVTFCLHLKKQIPMAALFTIDAAITRIEEVYYRRYIT